MKLAEIAMLSIMAFSVISCRHKDFCWDHPHGEIFVEVNYDDDNDPDDIAFIRDKIRATRLLGYHQPTGQMVLASDIDRQINRLNLDTDIYNFIAYNAGTQNISFLDRDKFYHHVAITRECDILEPLYDSRGIKSDIDLGNGEAVVIPDEPLWSVGGEALNCLPGDTIRLTALPLHCRYTFEMRNIEGLEGASRLSSFITGMSHGATLGTSEPDDTPVTIAVPASVAPDRKTVIGNFICFGYSPENGIRNRMGLFVEMKDGKKIKLIEGDNFDMTEQIRTAPNRRRVHIIIDGVRLPESAENAGFEVDVNPWGDGEDLDIDYDFM